MEFPNIEDLRIIVASYVSDDRITLINLLNLWKIQDLYKLKKEYRYTKENIYYKLRPYIPLYYRRGEIQVIGKNDKYIKTGVFDLDTILILIDSGIKTENVLLWGDISLFQNSEDFLIKNHFKSIQVNSEEIDVKFIQNLNARTIIIQPYVVTGDRLEIHDSVQYLELNINACAFKLITSEKSNLRSIKSHQYNSSLLESLNSGLSERLKELYIQLESLNEIKNCDFKNLKKLVISVIYAFDIKELSRFKDVICNLNLVYFKINTISKYSLTLLPNPETLRHLTIYSQIPKTEMFILNSYKKLESLDMHVSSDIDYIIPPNVKKLKLEININLIKTLYIPNSVSDIRIRSLHYDEAIYNIKFETPENIRKLEIESSYDNKFEIVYFNSFMQQFKNLESFIYDGSYISLLYILRVIPKNTKNIIINNSSIVCNMDIVDLREFTKLRWLEISINQECDFCDPVILLPTSGFEPVHVDIKGNRNKKFKNIRGLYIKN